jgi:hypothetical protein
MNVSLFCYILFLLLANFVVDLFINGQRDYDPPIEFSAAIVSFIHDERDILDYWIQYHSRIVGIKNIAIVDHDSPRESKRILKKWEKQGLIVVRGNFSYFEKGAITLKVYRKYFPNVQIAIPLDADEVLFGLTSVSWHMLSFRTYEERYYGKFAAEYIRYQLKEFAKSEFACISILDMFNNCNTQTNDTVETINTFSTIPPEFAYWRKRIFKLAALQELDHGSHHGKFKGKCTVPHSLGLLHYHNRSLLLKVQRALNDLIGFGYANKTDTLDSIKGKLLHFQELTKVRSLWGVHKVHEIITYLEKGVEGLMSHCPIDETSRFVAPTIDRMAKNDTVKTEEFTRMRKFFDKSH